MKIALSLDIAGTGPETEPLPAFRARAEAIEALAPDFVLLAGEGADGAPVPPRIEALVDGAWITGVLRTPVVVLGLPGLHSLPFHVARALSAIDFLSAGRSGWMPLQGEADRFDTAYGQSLAGTADAQAREDDFIRATCALWDSWDDDALVLDKASGIYLDSTKVRRVDYRGSHYRTMGPLNAARPPQGHPLLVRDAGASAGSTVPADVLTGPLGDLAGAEAPIRLVRVAAGDAAALADAVAAVAAGKAEGVHLTGAGALAAARELRAAHGAPTPTPGLPRRAGLGLAQPINAYAEGAHQ